MARRPQAWLCPNVTEEELIELCKSALGETGFNQVHRRRSKGNVVVSGIRGSFLKAVLVRFLPFGQLLRAGNRYKAVMKVGTFRGQTRLRMEVHAVMESDDSREELIITQGLEETIADSQHARDLAQQVIQAV